MAAWGHTTLTELAEVIEAVKTQVEQDHDQAIQNELTSHASIYAEVGAFLSTARFAVLSAADNVAEADGDDDPLSAFLP